MLPQEVLDFGKCFLNGVEIEWVRGKVFDTDTEPINKLKNLIVMVDPGIVEDKDTENTWVWIAFGQLWQLDRCEIQKKVDSYQTLFQPVQKRNLREWTLYWSSQDETHQERGIQQRAIKLARVSSYHLEVMWWSFL